MDVPVKSNASNWAQTVSTGIVCLAEFRGVVQEQFPELVVDNKVLIYLTQESSVTF